ncbi:MAG: branched-chain amino acid ABC transporter permease [Desulfonauticus sp.]|nr:branched-chain amino acid ABC transporter permease [Desulfonauticus sp.]
MQAYIIHLFTLGGVYVLLSSSLNIIVGLGGLVSLGHAAFWGIGAYSSALLSMHYHLPFGVLIFISGCISAIVSFFIGIPALKLKDEYLAVVTLGLGIIFQLILKNLDLTGGPDGLCGLSNFDFPPIVFAGWVWFYIVLCLFLTFWLKKDFWGITLTAIKENELTAQVLGLSPLPNKLFLFICSCFFAGAAGSIYAHYITFIGPNVFGLHTSILILCMVVLGGMGSVLGPVIGSMALFLLPEFLQSFSDYQNLVYGLLLIVILIFRPQGLWGAFRTNR